MHAFHVHILCKNDVDAHIRSVEFFREFGSAEIFRFTKNIIGIHRNRACTQMHTHHIHISVEYECLICKCVFTVFR